MRLPRDHVLSILILTLISMLSDHRAYAKPTVKEFTSESSQWRFAPLPSIAYNIERGVGYGLYLTTFKKRDLPDGVRGTRYEYSISASFFKTTGGYQYHKLIFDAPYLTKDQLRLQGIIGYESQTTSWYSGVGTPRALQTSYIEEKSYFHPLTSLWFMPTLTQPLQMISQALTISLGWIGRLAYVNSPPNKLITQETPLGVEGGFLSSLQLSLSWDSRDREPNTESGIWTEMSIRVAHQLIGSDWQYTGLNFSHRHYIKLSKKPWLVYAYRLGVDGQIGQTPFFQRGVMGGVLWTELGGNATLRGYKFGRFRGDLAFYSSQELRLHVYRFHFRERPIDTQLCPLIDIGIVNGAHDALAPLNSKTKHNWLWGSAGIGGRAVYDEGFVVRIDVMWALERYQTSLNASVRHRPQLGIYAMTGHTF
jgi:hypothetical protein